MSVNLYAQASQSMPFKGICAILLFALILGD